MAAARGRFPLPAFLTRRRSTGCRCVARGLSYFVVTHAPSCLHGHLLGASVLKRMLALTCSRGRQPSSAYLSASLVHKTRVEAYVAWVYYPWADARDAGYGALSASNGAGGGLQDPANHSTISFVFERRQEGGNWEEVPSLVSQPSDCLDVSQVAGGRQELPACAGAPAPAKQLARQANFTALRDSARYAIRITAFNLALQHPPHVVAVVYAAACSSPLRTRICLSALEASGVPGAYTGLALLVVRGSGAGFMTRNISDYLVCDAHAFSRTSSLSRALKHIHTRTHARTRAQTPPQDNVSRARAHRSARAGCSASESWSWATRCLSQ